MATMNEFIAIDLEDPNDPNLKQVPPLNTLRWGDAYPIYTDVSYPVSNYKKAYLIYWKSTVKNEAPDRYKGTKHAKITVGGIGGRRTQANYKGILKHTQIVYKDKVLDTPYLIVPKNVQMERNYGVSVDMSTPISGYFFSSLELLPTVYPTKWE